MTYETIFNLPHKRKASENYAGIPSFALRQQFTNLTLVSYGEIRYSPTFEVGV